MPLYELRTLVNVLSLFEHSESPLARLDRTVEVDYVVKTWLLFVLLWKLAECLVYLHAAAAELRNVRRSLRRVRFLLLLEDRAQVFLRLLLSFQSNDPSWLLLWPGVLFEVFGQQKPGRRSGIMGIHKHVWWLLMERGQMRRCLKEITIRLCQRELVGGRLLWGRLGGKRECMRCGRFHSLKDVLYSGLVKFG